jgi:hypothetical protein
MEIFIRILELLPPWVLTLSFITAIVFLIFVFIITIIQGRPFSCKLFTIGPKSNVKNVPLLNPTLMFRVNFRGISRDDLGKLSFKACTYTIMDNFEKIIDENKLNISLDKGGYVAYIPWQTDKHYSLSLSIIDRNNQFWILEKLWIEPFSQDITVEKHQ